MKKRFSAFLAAGTAAVLLFSPCASAAKEEHLPEFNIAVNVPPQVLFIGDSIISGYGLDKYSPSNKFECDSFANMLSREFEAELPPEAEFRYWNEGLDGRTSGELIELLQSGELDDELAEADAVIISIGGNDMLDTFLDLLDRRNAPMQTVGKAVTLGQKLDRDLDGFAKNMPVIAKELNDRTDGKIFVQTLYNPMESTAVQVVNNLSAEKIARLNQIIADNSGGGKNYTVCDVFSALNGMSRTHTNILKYDIHPNADGHKLIAETLGKTIRAETYHYYDYAAEKKYKKTHKKELEERRIREEQEEKARARKEDVKKLTVTAAAGTGGLLIMSVLLVRHGEQKGG